MTHTILINSLNLICYTLFNLLHFCFGKLFGHTLDTIVLVPVVITFLGDVSSFVALAMATEAVGQYFHKLRFAGFTDFL